MSKGVFGRFISEELRRTGGIIMNRVEETSEVFSEQHQAVTDAFLEEESERIKLIAQDAGTNINRTTDTLSRGVSTDIGSVVLAKQEQKDNKKKFGRPL